MPEPTSPGAPTELHPEVELTAPVAAALLGWLVPGAGHLYQGRTFKGVLFLLSVTGLFIAGFYLGGAKVAYASPAPLLPNPARFAVDRWPFLCQAGIGAVAIPAMIERAAYCAGKGPTLGGWFYPPMTGDRASRATITSIDASGATVTHPDEFAKWNYDLGFWFELGTIYTVIAGLLNILAVYDAHSGPLVPTEKKQKPAPPSAQPAAA